MNTGLAVVAGLVAGVAVTYIVVTAARKTRISVTSINPGTPPQVDAFQSGVVKMTNVTLTHVNPNSNPPLYHAVLTYSDGSTNSNAVLTIGDISNLTQIGVPIFDNIDNADQIPPGDKVYFPAAATA